MDVPVLNPEEPDRSPIDVVYTPEEYRAYAEREAQKMLGVSWDEALARVASGELDGTLAEARLRLIGSLL